MSGKLLEEIRSADQPVEQVVRDTPDGQPEKHADDLARPGNPAMALATADHNGLPVIDVLEALLYLADPRAKCRQIAEQALQAFGSIGAVLSASIHDLTTRLHVKEDVAYGLKAIYVGMCSVLCEPIRERIEIGSFTALIDYVGLSLRHESVEVLRVLYLDRNNRLISDEEAGRGTVDHVPLYPREIVRRALELGASAVILVHNHPSGDPTPSALDASLSQEVRRALSVMNISLHDSLIVGSHGFASLRSLRKL